MAHRPGGLITNGNWKRRSGIWRLDSMLEATKESFWLPSAPGQALFDTPGTFQWTCPENVYFVSAVCVGGGGGGYVSWANNSGCGAGLGWKNDIPVVPGQTYTVVVGARGSVNGGAGGNSYFISLTTVAGYGGGNAQSGADTNGPNKNGFGGGWVGDGGGAGGQANGNHGTGGAGGYSGNGGGSNSPAAANSGGGGGGSNYYSSTYGTPAGGGVGLLGRGATGRSGSDWGSGYGGEGGSGGARGVDGERSGYNPPNQGIQGGDFGGGGGGGGTSSGGGQGGKGGVRLIWVGELDIIRAFPITNTGNL